MYIIYGLVLSSNTTILLLSITVELNIKMPVIEHFPFRGLINTLKTSFQIVFAFITVYLLLIMFSIPLILIISARLLLRVIFSFFYNGRLILMESENGGPASADHYANLVTIYYFMYMSGPCDIHALRKRIHHIFTTFKDKNGRYPYQVMLCSIVQKFGFFCWENTQTTTFDIENHIRYFPGCSDPNKIYSETEVFEAAGKIADEMWDETKPRWEFLVVPNMRKEDTGDICSVIHLRFNHAYVDGISACQICRLVIGDQPGTEFLLDPVNPPGYRKPSFVMNLMTYLQTFFLGPWICLKFLGHNENHIFSEGPLVGHKFFGRTTLVCPISIFKDIRKKYGCSTGAIQHYAYLGALRKLAEKKGFQIPDEILGSLIFAGIPYPNEYPQNRGIFAIEKMPIGKMRDISISNRLSAIDKICKKIANPLNYYELLTCQVFMKILGILPCAVIKKTTGKVRLSYVLSNVPGLKDKVTFNGVTCVNGFGTGPLGNGIRYALGCCFYDHTFTFGFQVEKSSLVKNRHDFMELILDFEDEIKSLMDSVYD